MSLPNKAQSCQSFPSRHARGHITTNKTTKLRRRDRASSNPPDNPTSGPLRYLHGWGILSPERQDVFFSVLHEFIVNYLEPFLPNQHATMSFSSFVVYEKTQHRKSNDNVLNSQLHRMFSLHSSRCTPTCLRTCWRIF